MLRKKLKLSGVLSKNYLTTGKIYYWEHFGMMDNPDYTKDYLWKMQFYINHGIIPNINLITTYETKDFPLTADEVEHWIQRIFF